MIKKKGLIIIFIIFSTLSLGSYVSIRANKGMGNNLISPQNVFQSPLFADNQPTPTPTPTILPTPTPVPVIFNENSSLKEEAEKLDPEDFSEDFKSLKKEASNL